MEDPTPPLDTPVRGLKTRLFEGPKSIRSLWVRIFSIRVWLKINQEGQTAGFGPCFHLRASILVPCRFLSHSHIPELMDLRLSHVSAPPWRSPPPRRWRCPGPPRAARSEAGGPRAPRGKNNPRGPTGVFSFGGGRARIKWEGWPGSMDHSLRLKVAGARPLETPQQKSESLVVGMEDPLVQKVLQSKDPTKSQS